MLNIIKNNKMFACVFVIGALTTSCGVQNPKITADVEFQQATPQTAFLERRDINDTFLFGVNVVDVQDFYSSALNLNIPPIKARLSLGRAPDGSIKLQVIEAAAEGGRQPGLLMNFDATATSDGKYAVNFASAGNEIEVWNDFGGLVVAGDRNAAPWQTAGLPKITRLVQDSDGVVVDVLHKVAYSMKDAAGHTDSRTGYVKLRIYLVRQNSGQRTHQTVGAARNFNIGFFSADTGHGDESLSPISHFKVDTVSKRPGQITVYLKDFPAQYEDAARRGVLAWNSAFGFDAIQVKVATDDINIGDPHYNVVRWFDGLDKNVPWAGYTPTNVDPDSGTILNTQVLINGSTTIADFKKLAEYTAQAAKDFGQLRGRIGNMPVVQGAGETPVVTFFTDPAVSAESFLQGFYYGVVMHEFGHALGLRHNFAASTKLDSDGTPSSVMDYEPNWASARRKTIGSYDHAAIRYGYFGESPSSSLVFCTDDDMAKRVDCNQGDLGDPADHTVAALLSGTAVLTNEAVAYPGENSLPMRSVMDVAFKLERLIDQFGPRKARVMKDIEGALNAVRDAAPAAGLSSADRSIVEKNLLRLKASYASAIKANASRGNAFVVTQ